MQKDSLLHNNELKKNVSEPAMNPNDVNVAVAGERLAGGNLTPKPRDGEKGSPVF